MWRPKDLEKYPAYGVDVLRLWAASVDYTKDISVGHTSLAQVAESLRKLRNTVRFILGNLADGERPSLTVTREHMTLVSRPCTVWQGDIRLHRWVAGSLHDARAVCTGNKGKRVLRKFQHTLGYDSHIDTKSYTEPYCSGSISHYILEFGPLRAILRYNQGYFIR